MQPANINQFGKADWLKSPAIEKLFNAVLEKGDELRVVGGAPRNHLLGEPVEDIDLATIFTPEQVIEKANAANIKSIPTGIDHGTVTLIVDDKKFEVTTLREDVTTDGRHAVVRFGTNWLEDAKRRDFTINALYVHKDGKIDDPLGTGLKDIETRNIRFIGKPEDRIREDYLRSLRFYRFAAWYGATSYDQSAIDATIRLRAGLTGLSPERIRSELFKLFSAPDPTSILRTLYQSGLLVNLLATVPNIIPVLKLIEIEKHLKQKPDPALRLALMATWSRADVNRLIKRFRLSNKESSVLNLKLTAKNFPEPEDHLSQLKWLYQHGKTDYLSMLRLAWSLSIEATDDVRWQDLYRNAKENELPDFPVNGEDLINKGLSPGPELGDAIKTLEELWLESEMVLTKEELLNHHR